jgi:hypothetical protein
MSGQLPFQGSKLHQRFARQNPASIGTRRQTEMKRITWTFWIFLLALSGLWRMADNWLAADDFHQELFHMR